MIRSVCVCLAGVIMLCGIASVASAKVWLLPDYQQRQLYSHRVNNNEQGSTNKPQVVKCQNYGLIPASEIEAGMTCDTKRQIMHLTCYGDCHCPSSYDKTEASCRLEGKIPGGSSCAGEYYTTCICDTSLYPHTSSSCAYTLSGASCLDEKGKHYADCIDPCEGLVDNETELGCDKYYDECPSKCELGKTCVPNDCSGYTLTSCPAGEECKSCTRGCGDNAVLYRTKGLAFQVDSPANGKISFSISGSDYQIDWGDGTIDTNKTHTYTKAGKYDIDIFGGVTSFSVSSGLTAKPIKLYSLNLPKATSIGLQYACPTLTGTIPELPAGLTDGYQMFQNCRGLTGTIPELPAGLTYGYQMFYGCSGLTGSIPELPAGLTNGEHMFSDCTGLTGTIPELPAGLTYGSDMFYNCRGLTGTIPALPDSFTDGSYMFQGCSGLTGITGFGNSLTDGRNMFYNCRGLTGSIPALPDSLENSYQMFYNCSGLTGTIPALPDSLTDSRSMFYNCRGLTGTIPALPDSLTDSRSMFYNCSGLTGAIPALPDSLENGYQMFSGCSGLTGSIPPLPDSLTNGSYMFSGCSGLTGSIPPLPDSLTSGSYMFSYCDGLTGITSFGNSLRDGGFMFYSCDGLTGSIPPLPDSLTDSGYMFAFCNGLSGQAPRKPAGLTYYTDTFFLTKVTNDGSWPDSAW